MTPNVFNSKLQKKKPLLTFWLATLEKRNLSCIPIVNGETYSLIQTHQRFQLWQQRWGSLE